MEATPAHVNQAEFEDYSFNEWKPSWPMSTKLILKLCIAIIN